MFKGWSVSKLEALSTEDLHWVPNIQLLFAPHGLRVYRHVYTILRQINMVGWKSKGCHWSLQMWILQQAMIHDIPTRSHGISQNIQVFCFDVLVIWYLRWTHLFVRITKLPFCASKHLRSKDPHKTVQQKNSHFLESHGKPQHLPFLCFFMFFHHRLIWLNHERRPQKAPS